MPGQPSPAARPSQPRPLAALLVACGLLTACGAGDEAGAPPRGLAYARNPTSGAVGIAFAPDAPEWEGGAPAAWSVAPGLPEGLELDPSTGVVSGTPAAVSPAATYTVTARNPAGSTSVGLVIEVGTALAPPAHLAYEASPAVYALGVAIAPGAPTSDGGPVASYAVAPSLPAGLSLDPATGVIGGTPTALAPEAVYTVTATNAAGASACTLRLVVLAPGAVWLSPATLGLVTRTAMPFAAAVAGGGAIVWSASAGVIDGSGHFTSPRVPGAVVVTAASAAEAAAFATADVAVLARSTGNVVVTLVEPASAILTGDALRVVASIHSRYFLERVEADLDGVPVAMGLGADGLWSGQVDLSASPAGTFLLRVAGIDFALGETELFQELTLERG